MIKITSLYKKYQLETIEIPALEDVSLQISKGETWGIIGPSQSGKSTLCRILGGKEQPTSGVIDWVENTEQKKDYSQLLREKKIATLFQDFPILWSKTLEQNLSLLFEIHGIKKQRIPRKIQTVLKWVELQGKAHCYLPQLSGEERQRAALACVLVHRPHVLLCDETRLRVEPTRKKYILELIRSLQQKQNLTVIYFTYDMTLVRTYCSHVAVFQHAHLIEKGEVQEVLCHPKADVTKVLLQNNT